MALTQSEIAALMRLIACTKDHELDCDECLSFLAELAEAECAGRSVSELLGAVEHHLSICLECREEYEILRATLRADGDAK